MDQFIVAMISGLAVSFIGWSVKTLYQYFKYYKGSKYSGTWKDEIYDEKGQVVKRDIFTIKHNKRTNHVTGHVKRIYPNEQTHRGWKCSGVIANNHFILSFWSDDLIMSDGCVYTVLVDDYTYEGYYLRGTKDEINKIKIRLTKENKS